MEPTAPSGPAPDAAPLSEPRPHDSPAALDALASAATPSSKRDASQALADDAPAVNGAVAKRKRGRPRKGTIASVCVCVLTSPL